MRYSRLMLVRNSLSAIVVLALCHAGLADHHENSMTANTLADMDLDALLLEVLPEEEGAEPEAAEAEPEEAGEPEPAEAAEPEAAGVSEAAEAGETGPDGREAPVPAEEAVGPEEGQENARDAVFPDEGVEALLGETEAAEPAGREAEKSVAAQEVPVPETPEDVRAEEETAPGAMEMDADVAEEVPAAGGETMDADPRQTVLISEMSTLERLRRKALEEHGKASLQRAREEMEAGRYEEAIQNFKEALRYIPDRPGNLELIQNIRDEMAESHYRDALLLQRRGMLEEALKAAREAQDGGHPRAEKLVDSIQKQIEQPPEPKKRKAARRWDEPSFKEAQSTIDTRLRRARQFYITAEYEKAKSEVDQILRDYPFNRDAIDLLEKIAERTYDVSSEEFQATRTKMIRDVRDTWNPRVYAIDKLDLGDTEESFRTTEVSQMVQSAEARIREKLGKIIIPEINFRNANIYDVIEFLNTASQEFDDPELPRRDRGVNFILQLPRGADQPRASGGGANRDPFAMEEVSEPVTGGIPPISFTARYLPLSDVLRVIMEVGGLKYRVKNNVVMIMPQNVPDADIIHRMYDVLPTLSERVLGASRDAPSERDSRGNDPFGARLESVDRGTAGADDWKNFFNELGVSWPAGSAISYMGSIGKLKVANTPENLAELESILNALNVTPRQIEIEARFVEVSQNDLEALGFEWLVNGEWNMLEHKDDAGLPLESRRRINLSTPENGLTTGNRFLTAGIGGDATMAVADDLLHVASVLTNPELSFILHALNQRENTDLLSAPKVVTKSGYEATMKVVTEYIYPTEFRVEIIESSVSSGSTTTDSPIGGLVEPGGFQMREVGVILQVMAEVSTEGQMINLLMTPQVVSDPTWENYGSEFYDPDSETVVRLPMRQPIFKVRSVDTSISIYNGATVVLGGMITEERTEVDDKIPLLGDIPLLGRLFRSRYESSQKRNLLIFVTARLVDPAGRVVKLMDDTATFGGEAAGAGPAGMGEGVPASGMDGGGISAF